MEGRKRERRGREEKEGHEGGTRREVRKVGMRKGEERNSLTYGRRLMGSDVGRIAGGGRRRH